MTFIERLESIYRLPGLLYVDFLWLVRGKTEGDCGVLCSVV